MSAPQSGAASSSSKPNQTATEPPKETQKQGAVLEEDDEFEDFPVEGMQAANSTNAVVIFSVTDKSFTARLAPGRRRSARRQHTSLGGELGRR